MANGWYAKGLAAFANAQVNYLTDDVRVQLVDAGAYTPNRGDAGHEFLESIPQGARLGTAIALASKTNVGGALGAADVTIPGVTSVTAEYLVLLKWTGSEGSTRLLRLWDTATGLPTIQLTAHNVIIQWPGGIVARLGRA